MRIALLSDIHANWQALEAVLRDCPPVDETLCLGDVVQARKAAQRAMTVAEACGFMFGAAWARRALARVAFAEGKFAAGGEDLGRARNIFRGLGASLQLADARSSVLSPA